jgi:hypothetical protein
VERSRPRLVLKKESVGKLQIWWTSKKLQKTAATPLQTSTLLCFSLSLKWRLLGTLVFQLKGPYQGQLPTTTVESLLVGEVVLAFHFLSGSGEGFQTCFNPLLIGDCYQYPETTQHVSGKLLAKGGLNNIHHEKESVWFLF